MGPSLGSVPDLTDDQRKHLDYIQAIVSRMASNSFLIKGWALTVAAAVYGFAAAHTSWSVAAVGLFPALVFWGLDAYYLWHERLFRMLYDDARDPSNAPVIEGFSMNIATYKQTCKWWSIVRSRTIWPVYSLIIVVGLVLVACGAWRATHEPTARHPNSKAALTATSTSSCTCSLRCSLGGQMSPTSSPSHRGTMWMCRCGTL